MQRIWMPLLVVGIFATTSSAVTAQDQSPPVAESVQRLEAVEAGHALTLPDDWIVFEPTGGFIDRLLDSAGGTLDEQTADMVRILRSMGMSYDLFAVAPFDSPADIEMCFTLHLPNPAAVGLEDAVTMNMWSLGALPTLVGEPTSELLELPVGEVGRIDYVQRTTGPDGTEMDQAMSMYLVTRPEDMHVVACAAGSAPEDHWRSIAETFELLPAEE